MPDDMSTSVRQEQAFDHIEFIVSALLHSIGWGLVLRPTEDFQQLIVAAFAYRTAQFAYLLHRVRQDFELNGVFRRMLYERVAGLELQLAGKNTGFRYRTDPYTSPR